MGEKLIEKLLGELFNEDGDESAKKEFDDKLQAIKQRFNEEKGYDFTCCYQLPEYQKILEKRQADDEAARKDLKVKPLYESTANKKYKDINGMLNELKKIKGGHYVNFWYEKADEVATAYTW